MSAKAFVGGMAILVALGLGYSLLGLQLGAPHCDSNAAEKQLANFSEKGIRGINHPPSQSNLLWVHVDPKWHALSLEEKRALDKVVRCAAQTFDDQGHPTWQAAYYDHQSGTLVALSSRRYDFRIKQTQPLPRLP